MLSLIVNTSASSVVPCIWHCYRITQCTWWPSHAHNEHYKFNICDTFCDIHRVLSTGQYFMLRPKSNYKHKGIMVLLIVDTDNLVVPGSSDTSACHVIAHSKP